MKDEGQRAKGKEMGAGASRWLLFLWPIALVLFLLGVVVAGKLALEQLRDSDRYVMPFTDIECSPPPPQDHDEFLLEVRYRNELPEQLHLLDEDLASRLAAAFSRHPWVAKVEQVKIEPPRQVLVRLTYRTPVLAVRQGEQVRAVDRHGVLLPLTANTDGLPAFPGHAKPPTGSAGTPWGDAAVAEAARNAAARPGP